MCGRSLCVQTEYARADKEFASARASGNSDKLAVATGHLRVAEEHMRSSEDVLNKGLGDFELRRVTEMKEFLRRYVRNQIYFHAKSIEGLTAAYQEIVKIDPETEKALFLRRIRELEFQHKGNAQMRQQQTAQQAANVAAGGPAPSPMAAAPSPMASPTAGQYQQQQPLGSPMGSPMSQTFGR